MVARLAGDFYPFTDELHARPAMQRLFRRLTLLWATALLAKAAVVFALLVSQPLATFVLAKSVLVPDHQRDLHRAHRARGDRGGPARGAAPDAHRNTSGMALSRTSRATT